MFVSTPHRFGRIRAKPPLAMPGQRIGLLGGSFNPAHEGHLEISLTALRRLGLDRVWWIVTPGNVLKAQAEHASLARRLASLVEFTRDRRIVGTAFEAELPSRYTVTTLGFLRRRYPGVHFVWLMGADCLAEFHRWGLWREIINTTPIAVVDRPGWHLQALSSPAGCAYSRWRLPEARARSLARSRVPTWTLLTGPLSPQSSSAIRATRRSPLP